MKTYLLSASAVIFLSVIVSLVLPEGKMYKTVVFVMRIVCILILIQPVQQIFKISTEQTDVPLFDYNCICAVYSQDQSGQLENLLQSEFNTHCDCDVEIIYDDGKFAVSGVTVYADCENQDTIEKIYEYLQELNYINISVYAKSD